MSDGSNRPGRERHHREGFGSRLRRHFLTGILVVTPAAVAGWVLYRLLSWVDNLLWENIRFGWVRPGGIPGVGLISVILLVVLVGLLVNNYVGRRFYAIWDSLLTRIPLFNKIYVAVKQIGEAFLASETTVFRAVGLIEYPRKGLWCLVFLTETPGPEIQKAAGEDLRSVFLPTTPNPTSGLFLMVPETQVQRLSMTVEEGLKMVISGGAYVPGRGLVYNPYLHKARVGNRRWWQRGWLAPRPQIVDTAALPPAEAEDAEPATVPKSS